MDVGRPIFMAVMRMREIWTREDWKLATSWLAKGKKFEFQ